MATVEDVAREAGLSVATVSRVLNNSSSVRQYRTELFFCHTVMIRRFTGASL